MRPQAAMEQFVLLLSPFAPHLAEELWQALGHAAHAGLRALAAVRRSAAPRRHDRGARADQRQAPRADRAWPPAPTAAALEAAARADAKIAELLAGKTIVKAIVVPGRMVNFVVKGG